MKNFEPTAIAKQMIDFQKSAFNNFYDAMLMIQGQTEKIGGSLYGEGSILPEEGRKAINEWSLVLKKGRDDFKKTIDDSFDKLGSFFVESAKMNTATK